METLEKDKQDLNIQLSDKDISEMTKNQFKEIVEKAAKQTSLLYLNKNAEKHSKSTKLIKNCFRKVKIL